MKNKNELAAFLGTRLCFTKDYVKDLLVEFENRLELSHKEEKVTTE